MTESTITEDPLERRPVRDFKFRSAFGLSFADLSPIVGIYTVFAIGLIAAGPAFLWAFPLVLIGQLFVCGVFGNLVSKWPLQGSVCSEPVAVITGAASGIGSACAALLRDGGWRISAIDLAECEADLFRAADVSDRAAVGAAVDETAARFGRIDLAVTAAGYYEEGIDVADISHAQWDRMLAVILGGTVNTFAAVLPHMLARGEGSIVAISSELALAGSATDLHYVAAKGAVLGLVKSLAMEVAETGIRVNAVAPGPTDTPLLAPDSLWREPDYLAMLPLGRLVTPLEIAQAVRYLATEGGMYCGEVISPNAGAVI